MTLLSILGVLSSAIFSGTSLLYTALGEVVDERSGIVNLGLEGVLLVSAASGFAMTVRTGNPYLGVLTAMLVGGLMNLVFGYLVISRKANQLASGLAVMFFGFGLSALIGNPYVGKSIHALPRFELPGLSSLPIRTRWGLGVRAVGENTDAAFASGRDPRRIRYQALFVGGLLAGMGAAHIAIAYAMNWTEYMTGGRGFIAVALVIFSRWHPIRAIAGALLFSAAVALQLVLQNSGIAISPFLLDTLPYLLTIVVLIAWGGNRKQSAPASLGKVYQGSQ
jgi:ABC-type uncharacterized transport system permease subunit